MLIVHKSRELLHRLMWLHCGASEAELAESSQLTMRGFPCREKLNSAFPLEA
jgi:hypothetical protein